MFIDWHVRQPGGDLNSSIVLYSAQTLQLLYTRGSEAAAPCGLASRASFEGARCVRPTLSHPCLLRIQSALGS